MPVDLEDDLALERPRRAGSPSPASSSARLQLVDAADADGADVDDLDRRVEAVAVLELVRGVEALLELLDPGVVDRPGRHLGAHLVALARVAAVGEAPHEAAVVRDARRASSCATACADELVEARLTAAPGRALLSAWRSVATNSCWRSVASRPVAAMMPGCGGTSTRAISSSSAMSQANSGPAPPAATSVNSRGS